MLDAYGQATRAGTLIVLRGRATECARLDELLSAVLRGKSSALVLRGESGIGKTALLDYASERAGTGRVIRAAGIESEMELAFAAVHQLCLPLLDDLERLPTPQRDALGTALGLRSGPPPDRFLVGLAVLTLLSHSAEAQPLICLVDDAQWMDRSSAQVLSFVVRRLQAESVAILFAERDVDEPSVLAGLPELRLDGLSDADGRELLVASHVQVLDEQVRDRIIAETRGNPLALLELPRTLTPEGVAGGFAVPSGLPSSIQTRFLRQVTRLPGETQRLLLLATAEPVGDPTLLWRAANELGLSPDAAAPAEEEGLVEVATRVAFRDPLLRSAIYKSAAPEDRRAVHRALAEATNAEADPDRRAWHRAHGTLAPDEDVADELEQSVGRAQARGGLAAAAAFLQRSVALTRDPVRRADRALAGARAYLHAGAFEPALGLLVTAEAGALSEFQRARADLLRGQIALISSAGRQAPGLLLKAAKRFQPLDVTLARETYLDAWGAAMFAGPLARGSDLFDVSSAAEAAPQPKHSADPSDLLLDGLAIMLTNGRGAAAPSLRRAVNAFRNGEISVEKGLQWAVLASTASVILWDFDSWETIITGQVDRARAAGAYAPLSIALHGQGIVVTWRGNLAAAATPIAEAAAVTEATGTRIAPYGAVLLAAFRGREAEATSLIEATIENAIAGGEGLAVQYARWASAILYNGLGRYEEALLAARQASDDTPELFVATWALPELIEAATRSGSAELASSALERLNEAANACDSDWGLGVVARSRALLSEGEEAERLYREAIDRLGRTRLQPELARSYLLYGEWLRREGRRVDAREQLRRAHHMLVAIGIEAFAERARRELIATGEKVRKRNVETRDQLTPQEEQIAQLARGGLSNPEIGARLYISPRTVEWHLHKVFAKLAITSRKGLEGALPKHDRPTVLA